MYSVLYLLLVQTHQKMFRAAAVHYRPPNLSNGSTVQRVT